MPLQKIPLSLIDDHPENPRVVFREEVIAGIAANLNGEFPQKHAIHVRAVGERFQVISGHHRKRGAEAAGLTEIWAWVEELDDEQAFMELATSNNQGELSPLEIGIHALQAVPLGKGGRGKKGGLKEYAEKIGKSQQYISQVRDAAEVAKHTSQLVGFVDKAQHLSVIHRLPEPCWSAACDWLSENAASVKDVQDRVAAALAYPTSPVIPRWREAFLPETPCIAAIFCGRYRAGDFERLSDLAERVWSGLDPDLAEQWSDWLHMNTGNESWDQRRVQEKRVEFENLQYERDNKPEPDDSAPVQVILADPPWRYEHAKQNRAIENQYPTAPAEEIATHLSLAWVPPIADDCVLFLWTTAPKLQEAFIVLEGWGFTYKTHAVWDKERMGMGYWFRSQHELLLVATRGNPPTPEESKRLPSLFREKRDDKHSKKPKCVYDAIESMFPDSVKFEMYQREPREGWKGGGNEA